MDWCRVVGPRGLCRPLDEKQVSNKQPGPSRPVRASRRANTGQGRAGQGRAGPAVQGRARAGQGRAGPGPGQGQGRPGQARAGGSKGSFSGRPGQGRAGQGRAATRPPGQGRAGQGNGSRPWGVPPQTPNTDQKHANGSGFGVLIITD